VTDPSATSLRMTGTAAIDFTKQREEFGCDLPVIAGNTRERLE
jgi:hypothetical protein